MTYASFQELIQDLQGQINRAQEVLDSMSYDEDDDVCVPLEQIKEKSQNLLDEIQSVPGALAILEERIRQLAPKFEGGEGWTADHDDRHTGGSLAKAAVCYAAPVPIYTKIESIVAGRWTYTFCDPWPWSKEWDRRHDVRKNPNNLNDPTEPVSLHPEDRRDLLVKAGSLIAAEIDRLDRLEKRNAQKPVP